MNLPFLILLHYLSKSCWLVIGQFWSSDEGVRKWRDCNVFDLPSTKSKETCHHPTDSSDQERSLDHQRTLTHVTSITTQSNHVTKSLKVQWCRCGTALLRSGETWAGRLKLFFDRKIEKKKYTQQSRKTGTGRSELPAVLKKDRQVKMADEGECVSKGLNILLSKNFMQQWICLSCLCCKKMSHFLLCSHISSISRFQVNVSRN